MRTTVTLESDLIKALQDINGAKTKAKAVAAAVQDYIRRYRITRLKKLKGKIRFSMTADEIRHAQR